MTHTNHQHLPNLLDLADSALRPLDGLADLRLAYPLLCHRHPHLANAVDALARTKVLTGAPVSYWDLNDSPAPRATCARSWSATVASPAQKTVTDAADSSPHQFATAIC